MTAVPSPPADPQPVEQDPHRFRFGVEMVKPFRGMTWQETARELESLGYATLFVPDHLDEGYGPISAMTAAAMATTELKVATCVFAADLRNPVVLARELASIDQLSLGRLEVGLGAGYQVNDYRGSGIPMDPPGVRVSRLIEHVEVLRGLFAGGVFNFSGKYYRVDGLEGTPVPFTPGGPPIFVAGGGPRLLRFAAQKADIIGVNVRLASSVDRPTAARDAVAESIDEKLGWIKEAAGGRFDDLVFHQWVRFASVTDRAQEVAESISQPDVLTPEQVLTSPSALIGTVDQIAETLHERRERWGFSYYTIAQASAFHFAPILERLKG